MMSLDFIADSLDGDGNIDFKTDMDRFDLNNDGEITADDCPFPPGSAEAKLWWRNIMVPYAQQSITAEHVEQYGDSVVGAYKGKPLVPGQSGAGQGDFQFLVDKIRITQGLSYHSSVKIAGKVQNMRYGQ
jgi:hypothetical protein